MWAKLDQPGAVYYDITWTGFCGSKVPDHHLDVFNAVLAGRDASIKCCIDAWNAKLSGVTFHAKLGALAERVERIAALASFLGMGLVGVGGMLLGLDSSIDPLTGTRILLSLFAAAVLGGLGSAPGAVLGAVVIGMAEELSVLVVGSQYRAAVGFVAILLVLTLRPRGLLGERAY